MGYDTDMFWLHCETMDAIVDGKSALRMLRISATEWPAIEKVTSDATVASLRFASVHCLPMHGPKTFAFTLVLDEDIRSATGISLLQAQRTLGQHQDGGGGGV